MKKFLLTIIFLLNFSLPVVALANSASSYQLAQLSLDSQFRPSNSPAVELEGEDVNAADYGNYFLQLIAGSLIYLAAPVAIIIIAVSGLLAVISSGDSGTVEKAKDTLKWAVVGLVIIIFSWMIIQAVITLVFTTSPADSDNGNQQNSSQQNGDPNLENNSTTENDPFNTPE
jgi:TRAP-type mannitol/chloroaromatic compound transport system permease small subunit